MESSWAVPATVPIPVPGFGTGLARSLDLSLQTSGQLRPASIYIGLQFLAILGPVVLQFVVVLLNHPEFVDFLAAAFSGVPLGTLDPQLSEQFALLTPGLLIASLGVTALGFDSQIIGMMLLAGRLVDRPLTLRAATTWARARFWAIVRGGFLVGIPTAIINFVLTEALGPVLGEASEGTVLVASTLATLAMLPFVYVAVGVVLGGVGALEAARRSVRLEQANWRLALLVAVFSVAIGYIQFFALNSGGDLLVRVGTTLGLGFEGGAVATALTALLILAAIVALGSLTFTIAALASAPQVLAFVSLTGYLGALPQAAQHAESAPARWVSRPMLAGIVIALLLSLLGIASARSA